MIRRLFSDTGLLVQPIFFERGINIILGKYSNGDKRSGINGIGKSSVIRLIDFALLSNSSETTFLQPKYNFLREENHSISLEFSIGGEIFIIKRSFKKDDTILFGPIENVIQQYSKSELKTILTGKFFPFENENSYFEGERYGTLMDFFIKDDIEHQKRKDPLNFSSGTAKQFDKAIINFYLLGLPTKNIIEFKNFYTELQGYSETIKGLEKKIKDDYGKSLEEFKSERIKIEKNIRLLEDSLRNYTFLENYKEVEVRLTDLTLQIESKLKEYHAVNRRLRKVKDSYQLGTEINLQEIQNLYNEISLVFGKIVTKSLEDITLFKRDILANRNKFLIEKENQLTKMIETLLSDISKLEKYRSSLYKQLEEKGALESITNGYEQLTEEKAVLAGNLQVLNQIDELQTSMGNVDVNISTSKRDILSDIKQCQSLIEELRELFIEILQNAIFLEDNGSTTGFFDISANSKGQRRSLPLKIEVEIPKADALGQSRLKIVAYDLMVYLNIINKSKQLPDFLIHDGVYHGISTNTKIKSLNYIFSKYIDDPRLQYIVTFNEDEIFVPEEMKALVGNFSFEINDYIRITLTDNPSEMLFKRDFK